MFVESKGKLLLLKIGNNESKNFQARVFFDYLKLLINLLSMSTKICGCNYDDWFVVVCEKQV